MYIRKNPNIPLEHYAEKTARVVRSYLPGRCRIAHGIDDGLSNNPHVSQSQVSLIMGPGRLFGNLWLRTIVRLRYDIYEGGRVGSEMEVKVYDRKVDLKKLENALENMTLMGLGN